jgi:hypothetical protein
MIVEVVQADLAPGDDFRVAGEHLHAVKRGLVGKLGFMGMDADGRVNEFVFLSQLDAAIEVDRSLAIADSDDAFDPSFARTSDHLLAIRIEAMAFEMGVGVYKHSRQSSVVSKPLMADGR